MQSHTVQNLHVQGRKQFLFITGQVQIKTQKAGSLPDKD